VSTAVKLSDELVTAARSEAERMSRSMTQQIEHWARVGRAVERTPGVSLDAVRQALTAGLPFDSLNAEERLVALGEIERLLFDPRGDRSFHGEQRAAGEGYTVLDSNGAVVEVGPDGTRRVVSERSRTDDRPPSA
jgi:hypothetical protein